MDSQQPQSLKLRRGNIRAPLLYTLHSLPKTGLQSIEFCKSLTAYTNQHTAALSLFVVLGIKTATTSSSKVGNDSLNPQEVGGTLIGEDRLVLMSGSESVEWYKIH